MDNALRGLANTVSRYTEMHRKAWGMTPEEVKEMMTMKFPLLQTTAMQIYVKRVGDLKYDSKKAAAEIKQYQKTHLTTNASQNG